MAATSQPPANQLLLLVPDLRLLHRFNLFYFQFGWPTNGYCRSVPSKSPRAARCLKGD